MKTKYAIGISINGTEVRTALMCLEKGKAVIKALEKTTLSAPVELSRQTVKKVEEAAPVLEAAFDLADGTPAAETESEEITADTNDNQSVSQIYALLDKFQNIKSHLAINCPTLTVKYDYVNRDSVPKEKKFKRGFRSKTDGWSQEDSAERTSRYININDEKALHIDYEQHPSIIDLMEEVNQFRGGNMNLVLMHTNELALVDLVKEIYKFKKEEITAIVYVEEDFSRVIFMKGKDILSISPIIHKGSQSDDVLDVIYSRIIFAQDHHFIPEINKILVAGHSSKLKAKFYFREKFPSAVTAYMNSRKIRSDLRFKDKGLLFSRYALPIALAWKALQKKVVSSRSHNLLPEYILERQRMPHLASHGYLLLMLLALTAFSFTWLLVAKNVEISKAERQVATLRGQLDSNKPLTDRVQEYDDQIIAIGKKIALVDSFCVGHDQTTRFLQVLNAKISATGGIWVTQLTKTGARVQLSGIAKRREQIPALANTIGGANLKRVTRTELRGKQVYSFQLEKSIDEIGESSSSAILSMLSNREEE